MTARREITRADIMPIEEYAKVRVERRGAITDIKRNRRVEVGPFATFSFENYETMWHQVHEMLLIERGGEEQISGELEAYNPLVPKGRELVATLMFEVDDRARRHRILGRLGGVEETAFIAFADETVGGVPESEVERSTAEGRASSVHFLHFPFTAAQIGKFRQPGCRVTLGLGHPEYRHTAAVPEAVRAALAGDFD